MALRDLTAAAVNKAIDDLINLPTPLQWIW